MPASDDWTTSIKPLNICVLFGTRPEAIKLAPVVHALRARPAIAVSVVSTQQHTDLLEPVLSWFGIEPSLRLSNKPGLRSLNSLSALVLEEFGAFLQATKPDCVVVQGDTSSALMGALAAFNERIPVAHVEAGLRTFDRQRPFPEEVNRVLISRLATVHFPPTIRSYENLIAEGIEPHAIQITGNTVVDAMKWTLDKVANRVPLIIQENEGLGPLNILVTAHRRESWDGGIANIFDSIGVLGEQHKEAIFWLPIHSNPVVRNSIPTPLEKMANVRIIDPLTYPDLIWLLDKCEFVITDSGGLQEEAVALGKPVLVTRTETDRPEGVEAGLATLVGTDVDKIVRVAGELLSQSQKPAHLASSIYGDGQASERIAEILRSVCTSS